MHYSIICVSFKTINGVPWINDKAMVVRVASGSSNNSSGNATVNFLSKMPLNCTADMESNPKT